MSWSVKSLLPRLTSDKKRGRIILLFILDMAISLASFVLAILLRFGFTFPVELRPIFWNWALFLFLLQFFPWRLSVYTPLRGAL